MRPKNSSTNLRATCVESTRSAGLWKEPTFSAREWRSATDPADGAHGSCTCTKSSCAMPSASSIVRAMSTGGEGLMPLRDALNSSSPTPSVRTPPSGSNRSPGFSRAARISLRDSRTNSDDRDGASSRTRCPRSASSRETSVANAPTSFASSSGCGATWAMAKRSATPREDSQAASAAVDRLGRDGRGRLVAVVAAAVAPGVDQQDLQRARDRDGAQRAEHARDLGADQDRHEHHQRRELHRAAVDERLQHVVLELLVEHEEDEDHDPGGDRGEERD